MNIIPVAPDDDPVAVESVDDDDGATIDVLDVVAAVDAAVDAAVALESVTAASTFLSLLIFRERNCLGGKQTERER